MAISNSAADIRVYINGVVTTGLQPIVVERFAGGRQLDRATLEYATYGQSWTHPAGLALGGQDFDGNECRIVLWNGAIPKCIHYGFIHSAEMEIGPGEMRRVTSALKDFHFQPLGPVKGMTERHPVTGADTINWREIVFNPRIDGRVLGNRRPNSLLFLDQESVRTARSQGTNGGIPEYWTISDAVQYLCGHCNQAATFIDNPTPADLNGINANDVLRDLRISIGSTLPEALDKLLDAFGFTWYVDLSNPFGRPRIRVFRRGVPMPAGVLPGGPKSTTVRLDAVGGTVLDSPSTEVYEFQLDYDSSATANIITAIGGYYRQEETYELVPSWNPADDAIAIEDTAQHSAREGTLPETARVWRDWVLNEAGDYTGLRPGIVTPALKVLGLNNKAVVPRRRRFLPTLTLRPDGTAPAGQHDGIHVEYTLDGGTTWKPLEELGDSVEVLNHECGIRFAGLTAPLQMKSFGYPQAKVRVTATIELDDRLQAEVDESGVSPLVQANRVYVDCGEAFVHTVIAPNSELGKKIAGAAGALKDGSQDDRTPLMDFTKKLADAWNIAECSGVVAIDGLPARSGETFQVGDVITQLSGRGITFGLHPVRAKYPQVVAVAYMVQEQAQRLTLQGRKNAVQMFSPRDLPAKEEGGPPA